MSAGPILQRPRVRTGTITEAAADVRTEITRVLSERSDAIVCDSVGTFPYGGPQPLETDYCERLWKRLLQLFSASIDEDAASR